MTTTTIPRFARAATNGAISYTSRNGSIPTDQLRALAPSIFAEDAHGSRSEKYAHIPTSAVLERLMSEGFRPYAVMQGGSRDAGKRAFTKHVLRLRHDSQELQVGGTHNEIVLLNSHDGTSSYRLMAGVFRLVCGNGMIVAQSMIEDIRISHKGDVAGLVLDGCIEIMERLPEVSESIGEMSGMRLTAAEQTAFARAALVARYDDAESPIRLDQVLAPRRREDSESNLWNVLNRTQENLIRGGVNYVQRDANGQRVARRQTREIRGVDQNTTLNRALWTLAEEMKAIKTAG
ncbi:MAG: DUF932 domain-containing protein [Luteolibacter sp.]